MSHTSPAPAGPAPPGPAGDPGAAEEVDDERSYPRVDADLSISVDTDDGRQATGRLTADGHRLRFDIDHPWVLIGATRRSSVAWVARGLAEAGLSAEIHGPRGRLLTLDPSRTSRISVLLTGSPHIAVDPGAWRVAARHALTVTLRPTATWVVALAVATGAAAVAVAARSIRVAAGTNLVSPN